MVPLWDGVLAREGYDPFYVVMVRDPWEVASSLSARNDRMPRSHGLLLWANYMVAGTRDSAGLARLYVAYDDLLADPVATLDRLEAASGYALPRRSTAARLEIDRFLKADLRHHRRPEGAELVDFPLIDRLYRALLSAARGQDFDASAAVEVESWLASLKQAVGPTFAALKASAR